MRFPRMAYTSVAVDASALPSTAGIRACERGTPALSAYLTESGTPHPLTMNKKLSTFGNGMCSA